MREKIINDVVAYVKKLPRKERIKIAGQFHEFGVWPGDLSLKPDGWDKMDREEKSLIMMEICDKLDKVISRKASSKYWYIQIRGHSKKEFREFWKNRYRCKEPDYQMRAYLLGIWTGLNIVKIIILTVKIIAIFT